MKIHEGEGLGAAVRRQARPEGESKRKHRIDLEGFSFGFSLQSRSPAKPGSQTLAVIDSMSIPSLSAPPSVPPSWIFMALHGESSVLLGSYLRGGSNVKDVMSESSVSVRTSLSVETS